MRVIQIIDSLKMGGAQSLLLTFAEEAKKRMIPCTVVSLKEVPDSTIEHQLKSLGAKVIVFPSGKLLNPNRLLKLSSFLKSQKFDVANTHLSSANIAGAAACRLAGVPVVATLHSAGVDPRHYHPIRFRLEMISLKRMVSRVVAVGRSVADFHREYVPDIEIISNAISLDSSISEDVRDKIRTTITGDAKRPLILSTGRLSLPKGYPDLIEAFSIVHKKHPDAVLAIAGEGVLREQLTSHIQELNLQDSVRLLGMRTDIPHLLASADIYASSSHWEGMPVSILEAMAVGLPIVATRVGDVPLILEESGIVVEPHRAPDLADAICYLLENPSARLHLGNKGRESAGQKFSANAWMNRLLELYSDTSKKKSSISRIA